MSSDVYEISNKRLLSNCCIVSDFVNDGESLNLLLAQNSALRMASVLLGVLAARECEQSVQLVRRNLRYKINLMAIPDDL